MSASKIVYQSNPNRSGLDPDITSSPIHKHPYFQLHLITCYYLQPAGPRQRDSRICFNLLQYAAIMALIIRAQIKFRPDISNTQALVNSAISLAYAGHYPESIALSPINPPSLQNSYTHTHNHRVHNHLHIQYLPSSVQSNVMQPMTRKHKEHSNQPNSVNNAAVISDLGLFFRACKLKNSSW